jgi:hypothetical protein
MRSQLLPISVLSALSFSAAAASAQDPAAPAPPPPASAQPAPAAPPPTAPLSPALPASPAPASPNVAPAAPETATATDAPSDANNPALPNYDTLGSAGARAVGLAPPGYRPGDFVDTRLTWTFGDDDFLHKTGELIPLSPTFSVGDRPQYKLFFDSLNSQYAGRENLAHLVLYKKLPSYIPRLTTEAAVVLRFDMAALATNSGALNQALYDAGSYIRLFYNTREARPLEGFSATFFPLDTDRFRIGYLYDISWGGTNANLNQSIFPGIQGSSPGMKLQYDSQKFYAFAGFKTATIVEPLQVLNPGGQNDVETVRVGQTNFGLLGGLGADPAENLRFDVGAGFFQQGKQELEDVLGEAVYTAGGSARIVYHHNMPVPQSVDFRLYKNDPMAPMMLFAPTKYDPHEIAWSVSLEGSYLEQHLKDFDVTGATKDQGAYAGALQGVMRLGYTRLSITSIIRDLNFVNRNVPGFIPFETLPSNTKTDPELFGAVTLDHYIPSLHLTPGIGGGLQLPSTFKSEFTDAGLPASRTVVVRSQGNESILPYDKDRTPIFQGRVSLRWTINDMLSAYIWLQYVRDNNGTLVVEDPTQGTASLRVFQSPDQLGTALSLQARY